MQSIAITTAATQTAFYHAGGRANFSANGTWGGTSLGIEINLADSTLSTLPAAPDNWVPLQDAAGTLAITDDYGNTTEPLAPCWIRPVTTGGTGIALTFNWKPVKFL